jgi:carboxylesterase type B
MTKCIFLLLIIANIITGDDFSPELLINTPSLGLIQGEINPLVNNVRQFIGIPFAQPPIGTLRFKPPISPLPVVNDSSSAIYITDALSTGEFQCPVRRTAAYLANNRSGSVYLYSFEYVPLSSPFAYLSQSVHGQELPFVFNSPWIHQQ